MKRILNNLNPRFGYDGWCVEIDGHVLTWTFSTTRQECREIRDEMQATWAESELFRTRLRIVKSIVKVDRL